MGNKPTARDRARLEPLIREAIIDCYDEDEQRMGLATMVEDRVVCPFKARVIGEDVEVVNLSSPESGLGLDAICRHKGKDYRIDVASLEWPKKKPEGFEWIEAYLLWRSNFG